MRRRPPLGIASFRPGLQFLRSGILILLLASFLLTMLYIDFTDDKMQAPVLEMVENVASGLEDEQDSQAMPEEEQPDGTESVSAGSKPGSDVQDGGRVPEVLNIQPFHGPARGGIEVTIHGRHFMGHGEWATSAFIGSKRCLTAEVLDLGTLVCGLPPVRLAAACMRGRESSISFLHAAGCGGRA